MSTTPRVLPHEPAAEEAVIGSILFSGRCLDDVIEHLRPEDFYDPALQAIYEAMLALSASSEPIDLITVAKEMRRAETLGKLRARGGEAYLAELSINVATVENIEHHARLVAGAALERRLILAASSVVDRGYVRDLQPEELSDLALERLYEAGAGRRRDRAAPLSQIVPAVVDHIEATCQANGEGTTGIPTGYDRLDEATAGLHPGDLIIVAGRPAMGKSALAGSIAENARAPVLIFSLEMPKEALTLRWLGKAARVDVQRLRGRLSPEEVDRVLRAAPEVQRLPIDIDDTSQRLTDITARARRWRAQHRGPALIVVDYLQLVQATNGRREQSREQEISQISRTLKGLAKELAVPVIALSQLSRKLEERKDRRPIMSDLRESGAIEQDADVICFVYRDEVYNKESDDRGIAEVIIGKQRQGPLATVRLVFLEQYTRFENLATRREDAGPEQRSLL